MKINIKATGIELTPAILDYVNKKVSSIDKYLDKNITDVVAQVEVGRSTRHHKTGNIFRAEVHITGGNINLYAVSEEEDLYAAIDLVKDEIIHNAVQSKDKRKTLARKGAEMMKNVMKGLAGGTARGFSWSMERLKFKGFRGFKSFKKRP
ncbi:MAG: ribosome-associated translation inhibitor RaiA [Candidatus Zambryskibacteria bacterium]|nr:ribosome-associated translation inhibitor RaiA [Candidatus Zambryskibacteria bacterium]